MQYNNYYDATQVLKPLTITTNANAGSTPPLNALRSDTPVTITPGFWPCLNTTGDGWVDVEDHRGEEGYVDGEAFTIVDLGPYPSGWSTIPPEPTDEEKYYAERAAVEAKYSAPWNGLTGGVLTMLQMTMTAAQCEVPQNPEKIAAIGAQYQAALVDMQNEFNAIDEKYGV